MTVLTATLHKKVRLNALPRIVVTTFDVDHTEVVEYLQRKLSLGDRAEFKWPDGKVEEFKFSAGGMLVGPGDSRLLPPELRHTEATWYVDSARIYAVEGNQPRLAARVPRTVKTWHTRPPEAPGKYLWRRTWQWEPVEREIAVDGTVFSHRYEQRVPASKVGGEWSY